MRSATHPEIRMQDFAKMPFLCADCEQVLSKFECYFANKVFFPVLNKKVTEVTYDERLLKFIISLSWRTLKKTYDGQCKLHPWIKEQLDEAEKVWRDYLLDAREDVGHYESYIMFLDTLPQTFEFPPKFHWYAFRSVDSTLASDIESTVFSYMHFPQFFFVSTIRPLSFSGWDTARVEKTGKYKMHFVFNDKYFNNFLVSRYNFAFPALDRTNPQIKEQIDRAIDANPQKFLKSTTLQFHLKESKRKRLRAIQNCSEVIKTLIQVVDCVEENPELTKDQQAMARLTGEIVADSLFRLPSHKAIVVDALLKSTVALANEQHPISECNFETDAIKAKFIVALHVSDEARWKLMDSSLDSLKQNRAEEDERVLVVISVDPFNDIMPFGVAYDAYLGTRRNSRE
jgi:hypothetical protein